MYSRLMTISPKRVTLIYEPLWASYSTVVSGPLGVWACNGAGAAHSTIISSNAMMPQERFENLPAWIDLWNNDANASALYPF